MELRAIATDPDDAHFLHTAIHNGLNNLTSKLINNVCIDMNSMYSFQLWTRGIIYYVTSAHLSARSQNLKSFDV